MTVPIAGDVILTVPATNSDGKQIPLAVPTGTPQVGDTVTVIPTEGGQVKYSAAVTTVPAVGDTVAVVPLQGGGQIKWAAVNGGTDSEPVIGTALDPVLTSPAMPWWGATYSAGHTPPPAPPTYPDAPGFVQLIHQCANGDIVISVSTNVSWGNLEDYVGPDGLFPAHPSYPTGLPNEYWRWTWMDWYQYLNDRPVYVYNYFSPGTMFWGTSTDRGKSWTLTAQDALYSDVFGNSKVLHESAGRLVYWRTLTEGPLWRNAYNGPLISSDSGRTWIDMEWDQDPGGWYFVSPTKIGGLIVAAQPEPRDPAQVYIVDTAGRLFYLTVPTAYDYTVKRIWAYGSGNAFALVSLRSGGNLAIATLHFTGGLRDIRAPVVLPFEETSEELNLYATAIVDAFTFRDGGIVYINHYRVYTTSDFWQTYQAHALPGVIHHAILLQDESILACGLFGGAERFAISYDRGVTWYYSPAVTDAQVQYLSCLTQLSHGTVYCGTGPNAKLLRVNLGTQTTEFLAAATLTADAMYSTISGTLKAKIVNPASTLQYRQTVYQGGEEGGPNQNTNPRPALNCFIPCTLEVLPGVYPITFTVTGRVYVTINGIEIPERPALSGVLGSATPDATGAFTLSGTFTGALSGYLQTALATYAQDATGTALQTCIDFSSVSLADRDGAALPLSGTPPDNPIPGFTLAPTAAPALSGSLPITMCVYRVGGVSIEAVNDALAGIPSDVWRFVYSSTAAQGTDWTAGPGTQGIPWPVRDFSLCVALASEYPSSGDASAFGNPHRACALSYVELAGDLQQRIWHELLHGITGIENPDTLQDSTGFPTWMTANHPDVTVPAYSADHGYPTPILLYWDEYLTEQVRAL